jgi:hypothetical protein
MKEMRIGVWRGQEFGCERELGRVRLTLSQP